MAVFNYSQKGVISTHSLTRRLTRQPYITCYMWNFNSQPHKEADDMRTQEILVISYFNSQPHKEADLFVS